MSRQKCEIAPSGLGVALVYRLNLITPFVSDGCNSSDILCLCKGFFYGSLVVQIQRSLWTSLRRWSPKWCPKLPPNLHHQASVVFRRWLCRYVQISIDSQCRWLPISQLWLRVKVFNACRIEINELQYTCKQWFTIRNDTPYLSTQTTIRWL